MSNSPSLRDGPKVRCRSWNGAPDQAIVHSPQHTHALRAGLAKPAGMFSLKALPQKTDASRRCCTSLGEVTAPTKEICFGVSLLEHPWGFEHAYSERRLAAPPQDALSTQAPTLPLAHGSLGLTIN